MLIGPSKRCRFALGWVAAALVWGAACSDGGGGSAGADTGGAPDSGDVTDDGPSRPEHTPPPDLAALVDLDELFNRGSLEVVIEADRSGRVPGDFDEPIWQIGLTFRSQTFAGADWTHRATLVLPDDLSRGDGSFAVLQQGTPNPVEEISDSQSFLPQYAAITADRLDMPVLLLNDTPPAVDLSRDVELAAAYSDDYPECFAAPLSRQSQYTGCLWALTQESGRLELFPALPVALVYVRSVTLMEELAELVPTLDLSFNPPRFTADRAGMLASGIGGLALRYAMALDGRISGVMAAGADIGDYQDYFRTQREVWDGDYPMGDPDEQLALLGSEAGEALLDAFDLSRIAVSLRGRTFLAAVGTNDPFTPLGLYSDYEVLLPSDRRSLVIAGASEGMGTLDHLLGWRVFLAHLFRGRAWSAVDSSFVDESGNVTVTARVTGPTLLQSVEIAYVQRHVEADDADYRDATWVRLSMTDRGDGTWEASFPNTNANTAFFVRSFDSQDIFEGPMTGELHVITQ